MKAVEGAIMLAVCAVMFLHPKGGLPALAVLGLLGVQAALFSLAKYGILPAILTYDKLTSDNGLLEMWTNLAIIAGMVDGGVLVGAFKGPRGSEGWCSPDCRELACSPR
jgi:acyl-[acyl-carrier-protein]-phospholipid O-acyltransferase/long-chain-fatty-acid--[acyl-carrier-protein] ligase